MLPLVVLSVLASAQTASVIKDIVIRGSQRVSRDAILSAMRTKVGQPYVQDTLDADRESIDKMGFFQSVDLRATPLEGGNYQVTVDVLEWPEIKEIRVTGNTVITTDEILKAISSYMKPGDVFNLNARKQAQDTLAALYQKKGYYGAATEFRPLAESPNTVNLVILELTVGTVSVQGNRHTEDAVMRRLIKTRSGDPFSLQKWSNDLKRIYNTQWFENVKSVQDDQREIGKIDLTADVKETRTGNFNVGVQIDPQSSVAGLLKLQENNLRGTGQSIGLNLLQSTSGGGLSADLNYSNPFYDTKDTTFKASLYSRIQYLFAGTLFGGNTSPTEADRYVVRRTGASIGFSRPVAEDLNVGLSTRFEQVKTENLKTTNSSGDPVAYIQQDGTVGSATLGTTRNRRDTDLDPSRGDWLEFTLEPGIANITDAGTIGAQPGNHTFVKSVLEYRKYISDQGPRKNLDDPRRVLAIRLRYGQIAGTVPFYEQFFAGGSDTVRGYTEDRFWGSHTILSTAEFRLPVMRSMNVIFFVDYGGAWGGYGSINDYSQDDKFKLHIGYGPGISFRTPLGPIRLDLGFDENGKSRTHFLIGTSF